jgi:hypothetical protein
MQLQTVLQSPSGRLSEELDTAVDDELESRST